MNTSGILWEMGRYTLCRPKYKPHRILPGPLRRKTSVRSWVYVGISAVSFQTFPLLQPPPPPLTELTRKDKPNIIVWGKETQQSFQRLKDSLTHYPVLATPLWERPFILQTDASDSGLAYVLAQRNEIGEEHPLAYGSRKLLTRERKFSTIEKEALAIVEGTRHFRVYLEGTEFTIETDHDPLTHLAKLKDSHGIIGRWTLSMQPYHYTINHKPAD